MFSQDSNLERGQQGTNKPETGIFSNNFGGLNKIASPLNVPYEDSPDLLNVDVDVSGNISKRKGTKTVYWSKTAGNVEGVVFIPFTTGLGYNMAVLKNGSNLSLLEIVNDVTSVMMTKSNVFPANASSIKINYVSTNEIEPRLIITTGITPPIQLKFVEQQEVFTGVGGTTLVINNAQRFANATTSNLLLFKNRTRVTGFSLSYNAGTRQLTISGLAAYTGATTFDAVLVVWQWWAEAYYWLGERFSASATRSNSAASIDKVVAIPSTLRDGVDLITSQPRVYPIYAYKSTDALAEYTLNLVGNPSTRVQYSHSDGVPYSGAGVTTPSPLFITFGVTADGNACDTAGNPQVSGTVACPSAMPVVFVRRRFINFNGGNGINNSLVRVYVEGTSIPLNTNLAVPVTGMGTAFYSLTSDLAAKINTTNTTTWGIDFTASTQIGLPSSSKVEVVNPEPKHLGTGANSNRGDSGTFINVDGSWVPAYGFGDFCNYSSGSFPTNVALYQGRLVFSGFLENSLRVLFSNQYDSVIPGKYFSNYQIDASATNATDAFDMVLSSSPDDVTKALIEWQQSLFLLTRKAVFRIHGGSNSAITSSNRMAVLVSNIGLINSYCVTRTDKSILYLSDTGVFDLSTSIDSTEYVAGDKSLKISPLFGIASNPVYESLPWLAFDSSNKVVYLAYPVEGITQYASRLFVYNTFRESWTEYYTLGNFNSFHGSTYIDRSTGLNFALVLNTYRNAGTQPVDLLIARTNYHKYLDFAQETLGTGALQQIEVQPSQLRSVATINNVRQYGYDRHDTLDRFGFRALPMLDIQDIFVQLETGVGTGAFNTLIFNEQWKKLPNGKIFLLENPGTGRTLRIYPRLPVVSSRFGRELYLGRTENDFIQQSMVFVDNVFKPDISGNYTVNAGGVFGSIGKRIAITAPLNSVIVTGEAYPCYYTSPMFTQEQLAAMKRAKYVLAYFDNKDGIATYGIGDINTASGQTSEDLVGFNKQRLNANISIKYEEDDFNDTIYDNYGYNDLIWDDALFDVNSPSVSYRRHVLFKEALQGISYSYQLTIWNYDETTLTLAGYQIMANIRGSKHINWTR